MGGTVNDMIVKFRKLDKFEGNDFRRWQKKMYFLLTTLKVVYVLSTPMPALVEDETLEQTRKRCKWENDNYICRGHILNGMSDALFDVYQNVSSAKELWDQLESKYMVEDASRQFTQHGLNMDESISVSSIIDKLLPSWKDFKHSLKHDKDELSLVQLGSYFRIEETLRAKESGKGKGKEIDGSSLVNMIEDGKNKNNKNNKAKKRKNDETLLVRDKHLRILIHHKDDVFAWWIDSGATCHACKDRCWFDTFHPVQDESVLGRNEFRRESYFLMIMHEDLCERQISQGLSTHIISGKSLGIRKISVSKFFGKQTVLKPQIGPLDFGHNDCILRPKEKDTQAPQSSVPSDPTNVANEAINEEPSLQLKELMDFCTKLQQRVVDLENIKTAQAQEITSLKLRVKKLEKKGGSRTHKLKRLYRVGRFARVVSSEEASLGDQEDASKQGRKIHDIDADEDITLENVHDARMFDVNDLDGDELVIKREVTDKAELKSARHKTKGVVIKEPSESTPIISLQLPSLVKGQGSKDKGKAKMIEPNKPLKKKDQIKFDEKEALRLQAKFDEEDRLAKEKAQQVELANIAWDDIQAKIDADYQLAERLQPQDQQELTIEEKSTLFVQLLEKRKKHFAVKRAEENRNRPPTRAQQRSIMCTYLKNMAGWKPKDLKNKSFANIQELFDKAFKRVNTFVDFRTELVKGT
ncbi:hypothetical protein Tco_0439068 [Tanacetum coccineum]